MGQEIPENENQKFVVEVNEFNHVYKNNYEAKIVVKPFSWNDDMGEEALEYLEDIIGLSYGAKVIIGTALAKLKILEEQGAKVDEQALSSVE